MTKYNLISFIICLIIATVNIVAAFIWGATLFSVVCCWVCYMAFALLIFTQEKTIKRIRDQQKLERKIFLDFFNRSVENKKENNDEIQD